MIKPPNHCHWCSRKTTHTARIQHKTNWPLEVKRQELYRSYTDKQYKNNDTKEINEAKKSRSTANTPRQEGNISTLNHLTLRSAISAFDSQQPINRAAIFLHDLSLNMILNWEHNGDGQKAQKRRGRDGAGATLKMDTAAGKGNQDKRRKWEARSFKKWLENVGSRNAQTLSKETYNYPEDYERKWKH